MVDIKLPTYYDKHFFDTLRYYHFNSPLNISTMKVRDWYRVLTEDNITMSPATVSSPAVLLPVRTELHHQDIDWTRTWRMSRLRGLPPDLTSHLFRLLHGLLPTQDRVARQGANRGVSDLCKLCFVNIDTIDHAFYSCMNNCHAANYLLTTAQKFCPGLSTKDSLWLNFNVNEDKELALVFLLAVGFKFIWGKRVDKKFVSTETLKAELSARSKIFLNSSFYLAARMLENTINDFPT